MSPRFVVLLLICSVATDVVSGQIFLPYTANQFPEDAGLGWVKTPQSFPAERTIEGGMLIESPVWLGDSEGTQNFYLHEIDEQADLERWILEWVVETTGPAQFIGVAPVSMVAANGQGYEYRFIIGVDQMRFSRGPKFPFIEIPLDPGPHHFKLECFNPVGEPTFAVYVDGEELDSGHAVGPYPTIDSILAWGNRTSHAMDNVTKWHFVNVGDPSVPVPAVSSWGAAILLLLLMTGGTMVARVCRQG